MGRSSGRAHRWSNCAFICIATRPPTDGEEAGARDHRLGATPAWDHHAGAAPRPRTERFRSAGAPCRGEAACRAPGPSTRSGVPIYQLRDVGWRRRWHVASTPCSRTALPLPCTACYGTSEAPSMLRFRGGLDARERASSFIGSPGSIRRTGRAFKASPASRWHAPCLTSRPWCIRVRLSAPAIRQRFWECLTWRPSGTRSCAPRRPGIRMLRQDLGVGIGEDIPRSELEDRFLTLCRHAMLPLPKVNQRITMASEPTQVDFLWRETRVIAETDGYRTHRTRQAFRRDRRAIGC